MRQIITINGQKVALSPQQLIQAGGEGLVYDLGASAVKLYHRPTPGHEAKLRHWLQADLGRQWPAHVLRPDALALNAGGQVAGFRMPRLPAGAFPVRQLADPGFRPGPEPLLPALAELGRQMAGTLAQLHRLGLVVGDLNDHNVHVAVTRPGPTSALAFQAFWIDTDSYQIGGYPCPVVTLLFLDPRLAAPAGPGAAGQGAVGLPTFSPASDWYSYWALLVRSLLQVHPYGGVHPRLRSLSSRAQARLPVWAPGVTYPRRARPLELLSDELLHEIDAVFGRDRRQPPGAGLLARYRDELQPGPCGHHFPASRPRCPICRTRHARPRPRPRADLRLEELWRGEGYLVALALTGPGGAWGAVVQKRGRFDLISGIPGTAPVCRALGRGSAGYRFGLGRNLLVLNPAQSPALLVLDLSQSPPRRLGLVESGRFEGQAVFATTSRFLYRLAGGYLLRGELHSGRQSPGPSHPGPFVESIVADARQEQTALWPGSGDDLLGYYRVLSRQAFFSLSTGGVQPLLMPEPAEPGTRVLAMAGGSGGAGILLERRRPGRRRWELHLTRPDGHLWRQPVANEAGGVAPTGLALVGHTAFLVSDAGLFRYAASGRQRLTLPGVSLAGSDRLLAHPDGLLLAQPHRLLLVRQPA